MPYTDQEQTDIVQAMIDAGESEANIATVIQHWQGERPAQEGSGKTSALLATARGVPAMVQGTAQWVANHPAAAQKIGNAGVTAVAASAGGAIGGVPGAIAGGTIRGVAPTQATIREVAGRMAGETPAVAANSGRALGVQNYVRETTGLKVRPNSIVSTGEPARAADNFADSMGQRIVRILGPDGKVVVGPEAEMAAKAMAKPGIIARASKAVGKVVSPLAPLQGALAMTDLAQMAEPNRHDIGMMGVGHSLTPEEQDAMESDYWRKRYAPNAKKDINLDTPSAQPTGLLARILRAMGR